MAIVRQPARAMCSDVSSDDRVYSVAWREGEVSTARQGKVKQGKGYASGTRSRKSN